MVSVLGALVNESVFVLLGHVLHWKLFDIGPSVEVFFLESTVTETLGLVSTGKAIVE